MPDINDWFSTNGFKHVGKPIQTASSDTTNDTVNSVIDIYDEEANNNTAIMTQFQENESQKRNLKPRILKWVCWFILLQLVIMNGILLVIIISTVVGDSALGFIHSIDTTVIPDVFDFLKYYISATVVELLGMLYFMVTRVFDNSILKFFELNQKDKRTITEKQKAWTKKS